MSRSVFKIVGSFGPGGALVCLWEKATHAIYHDAYEMEDPRLVGVNDAAEKTKKLRADYVAELFAVRGRLERDIANRFDASRGEKAYEELNSLIEKHVTIISKSEKGRLQRERMYFKNNPAQYQRRIEAAKTIERDTLDNLIKMALHIVNGTTIDKLSAGFDNFTADNEAGTIDQRVTHEQAMRLQTSWRAILNDYVAKGGSLAEVFGKEDVTA